MDTKQIIDKFKNAVIQIATPYSTGTGFFLAEFDIIITNEHVIRDNKEVVIAGDSLEKSIVEVIYIDQKYDLAFLRAPKIHQMPAVHIADLKNVIVEGDEILAVGHPFGLKYTATKGIISNMSHDVSGTSYIQHDAALNPGNSGGPLISNSGEVVGVNTFVIKDGNNIGFSLPVKYLTMAIQDFLEGGRIGGIRCTSCLNMVFENSVVRNYCQHCGSKITMISQIEPYEPSGINRTIEEMLVEMEYDISLSRMGPSNWTINRGSAIINIAYHEKSGLITGDAYLGKLPDEKIIDIYTYMLHQNYRLEGLTFSVKEQDIILSLLIFDQYLNKETSMKLFNHLLQTADYHDDILVDKYGASWINSA